MTGKRESGYLPIIRDEADDVRQAVAMQHHEASHNRDWQVRGSWLVRVGYSAENIWPHASLAAIREIAPTLSGIINRTSNLQWRMNMEQRLEFDQLGIHAVEPNGNCTCGLSLEVRSSVEQNTDAEPVGIEYEELRELVLSTDGHIDHRTGKPVELFIAGRVGPSQNVQYWTRDPGPLVDARWHCTSCGDLGEAALDGHNPAQYLPYAHPTIHPRNRFGVQVGHERWAELQAAEWAFWR